MAPGRIGQPMQSAQPEVIQSQPTRGYWESRRQWDREVKEALEGGIDTAALPALPASGVVAGSYTLTNLTVGADGRLTAAANGSLPATGVVAGSYPQANITVAADGRITAAANGAGGIVRLGANAGSPGGSGTPTRGVVGEYWQGTGGGDEICFPLQLKDGDRLTRMTFWGEVAAATAWAAELFQWNPATAVGTSISSGSSSAVAGKNTLTLSPLSYVMASPMIIYGRWVALASGNRVRAVEYTFVRP
jgi:hypothetical protein